MEFYTPSAEELRNVLQAGSNFVKATMKGFEALEQKVSNQMQPHEQSHQVPQQQGEQGQPVVGKFTAKVKGVEFHEDAHRNI